MDVYNFHFKENWFSYETYMDILQQGFHFTYYILTYIIYKINKARIELPYIHIQYTSYTSAVDKK